MLDHLLVLLFLEDDEAVLEEALEPLAADDEPVPDEVPAADEDFELDLVDEEGGFFEPEVVELPLRVSLEVDGALEDLEVVAADDEPPDLLLDEALDDFEDCEREALAPELLPLVPFDAAEEG